MMGTPVADKAVLSMSDMQKQQAIRKMKPVIAPIQTDMIIALGASFLASFISSVI